MSDEKQLSEYLQKTGRQIYFSKMIVAIALIIIGFMAGAAIIRIVSHLLLSPSELPFFELLNQRDPHGILFKVNEGVFSVSTSFFGYIVLVSVLGVLTSLCIKTLSLGSKLISEDIKFLFEKLTKEWEAMRKHKRGENSSADY